jgi:hypothetical protein
MRVHFRFRVLIRHLHMSDLSPHSYNANLCPGRTLFNKVSR